MEEKHNPETTDDGDALELELREYSTGTGDVQLLMEIDEDLTDAECLELLKLHEYLKKPFGYEVACLLLGETMTKAKLKEQLPHSDVNDRALRMVLNNEYGCLDEDVFLKHPVTARTSKYTFNSDLFEDYAEWIETFAIARVKDDANRGVPMVDPNKNNNKISPRGDGEGNSRPDNGRKNGSSPSSDDNPLLKEVSDNSNWSDDLKSSGNSESLNNPTNAGYYTAPTSISEEHPSKPIVVQHANQAEAPSKNIIEKVAAKWTNISPT